MHFSREPPKLQAVQKWVTLSIARAACCLVLFKQVMPLLWVLRLLLPLLFYACCALISAAKKAKVKSLFKRINLLFIKESAFSHANLV